MTDCSVILGDVDHLLGPTGCHLKLRFSWADDDSQLQQSLKTPFPRAMTLTIVTAVGLSPNRSRADRDNISNMIALEEEGVEMDRDLDQEEGLMMTEALVEVRLRRMLCSPDFHYTCSSILGAQHFH